jgi:hypothetical protein
MSKTNYQGIKVNTLQRKQHKKTEFVCILTLLKMNDITHYNISDSNDSYSFTDILNRVSIVGILSVLSEISVASFLTSLITMSFTSIF